MALQNIPEEATLVAALTTEAHAAPLAAPSEKVRILLVLLLLFLFFIDHILVHGSLCDPHELPCISN